MTPRVVADYVPHQYVVLLRVLAGLAVGLAVAGAVLPAHKPAVISVTAWGWFTLAAIAAGNVLSVHVAAQRIVARPQTVSSTEAMRLDDAIRSACARSVIAAGLGLGFLVLGALAYLTGVAVDLQFLRWVLPVLGLISLIAAPVAWAAVGRPQAWRVQRPVGAVSSDVQ